MTFLPIAGREWAVAARLIGRFRTAVAQRHDKPD
jgi:hypothetical protein